MNLAIRPPQLLSRKRRRNVPQRAAPKALSFAAGAAVAAFVGWFDRRRRHMARDKAVSAVRHGAEEAARKAAYTSGVAKGSLHRFARHEDRQYDDTTLARKVETEIFRPVDAPKGRVDVNVADGVVELRGTVDEAWAGRLVAAAERVEGVKEVRSMLKTAGVDSR